MRVVILRSVKKEPPEERDSFSVSMNTAYAGRLLGHLSGSRDYCKACADKCIHCRDRYGLGTDAVRAVIDFPAVLPAIIDDPDEWLPDKVEDHDVLVAISVHEEILISFLERFKQRGVIVPIEESSWISPYGKGRIEEVCRETGREAAFPKPFCSFNPGPGILYEFRKSLKIGKPELKYTVKNGVIEDAEVLCSAPCGATYYVARHLRGKKIDENLGYAADALLSAYPCTAGHGIDREFGDSIIHRAVQLQRDILTDLMVPDKS